MTTELPPPIPQIAVAPSKAVSGRAVAVEPPPAFDPGEAFALERPTRRRDAPGPADYSIFEPLGRQQKDRRRQIRGLAWMIGGILFLAIAAAVLSRL